MEEGPGEVHTPNALSEREENNVHREERVAGGGEKYSSLAQGQPGERTRAGQGGGRGPQLPNLNHLESGPGSLRVNRGDPEDRCELAQAPPWGCREKSGITFHLFTSSLLFYSGGLGLPRRGCGPCSNFIQRLMGPRLPAPSPSAPCPPS